MKTPRMDDRHGFFHAFRLPGELFFKFESGNFWCIATLITDDPSNFESVSFNILSSSSPGMPLIDTENHEIEFSYIDELGEETRGIVFGNFDNLFPDKFGQFVVFLMPIDVCLDGSDGSESEYDKIKMTLIPKKDLPLYMENDRGELGSILKGRNE